MTARDTDAAALTNQLKGVIASPGDPQVWESFYRSLWPAVFAIQYRHCSGNRSDAEDLCQDTLLYLLRRLGPASSGERENLKIINSPDPQYFYRWLHQICRRRYIDFLRGRFGARYSMMISHSRSHGDEITLVQGKELSPERIAAGRETVEKLTDYVRVSSAFSPQDKDLYELLMSGLSLGEIAGPQESLNSLYVRVHRLRQKLQRHLEIIEST